MSDSGQRKRIDSWLRRQVFIDEESRTFPAKFVIRHVSATNKIGTPVSTVFLKNRPGLEDIAPLVDDIESRCMTDAEGLTGTQRYLIQPTSDKDEAIGERLTLKYMFDSSDEDSLDSEPPTKSGLTAQLMRHNEVNFRAVTGVMMSVMSTLQRTIANQDELIHQLSGKQMEQIRAVEALHNQKHERDMMLREVETKEKFNADIKDKLMLLLPAVANKLAGKQVFQNAASPSEVMLQSILETLTPDQFGKLQTVLTPEQMMGLVSMMEDYQKRQGANGETAKD